MSKRKFGTIEERVGARGVSYRSQYRNPVDKSRISKTFKSEHEAVCWLETEQKYIASLNDLSHYLSPVMREERARRESTTLSDLASLMLSSVRKESTRRAYAQTLKTRIAPFKPLWRTPIIHLTQEHVTQWASWIERNYPTTMSENSKALSLLKRLFNRACRQHLMVFNFASDLRFKRVKPTKKRTPTDSEIHAIIGAVAPEWRACMALVLMCGLRASEALAVKRNDINVTHHTVSVSRTIDRAQNITSTKTESSTRVVPVPPAAMSIIVDGMQLAKLKRSTWLTPAPGRRQDDRPASYAGLLHVFKTACKELEITGLTLHSGRNFVATKLLNQGVNPATVAGILGHDNPATTLKVYDRPSSDDLAAAMINLFDRNEHRPALEIV